ncbi:heavy metal transporter [Dokdonia sp. MED134]|uniref:heavy metal translocating P-type ATPase n=1 Tax=Dokdonia sp. MED134 TaxID=313590 RepID=UPI0000689EC5|nr:heavy-metal-associated domain-containing protein [Dokdonia sp. MED134]EAQ39178.1 heavy metal transporter [Dokdonia sp. MED134]
MKTTAYTIKGMTCNGCRTGVEQKLAGIAGVSQATVSLENEEAILTMDDEVTLDHLKSALPEKYRISLKEQSKAESETQEKSTGVFASNETATQEASESKLQQLKPLFLIFLFITGAAVLLHFKDGLWDQAMLDFMGLFYVVFSFFKFLDIKGFKTSFAMYDPLAGAVPGYGYVYPFIELALGLMFLMRLQIAIALVLTIVILGITTVGVTRSLLSKKEIQCACLGTALKLPMTEATFIENAIMIIMAVIMLTNLL